MMTFKRIGATAALVALLAAPAVATGSSNEKPMGGGGGMGTDVKAQPPAAKATRSVSALIALDPRLSTLNQALKATGLDRTLNGTQVVTLYAPTNAAFAALPVGELAGLLKPESKARLAAILQGHVVAGRVPASAIADRRVDRTLSGTALAYALPKGGGGGKGQGRPTVGGAGIIEADLAATNGVIHVIDRVILPQAMAPMAPMTQP